MLNNNKCTWCDIQWCSKCEPEWTYRGIQSKCVECEEIYPGSNEYYALVVDSSTMQQICVNADRTVTKRGLHCLVSDGDGEEACKECPQNMYYHSTRERC